MKFIHWSQNNSISHSHRERTSTDIRIHLLDTYEVSKEPTQTITKHLLRQVHFSSGINYVQRLSLLLVSSILVINQYVYSLSTFSLEFENQKHNKIEELTEKYDFEIFFKSIPFFISPHRTDFDDFHSLLFYSLLIWTSTLLPLRAPCDFPGEYCFPPLCPTNVLLLYLTFLPIVSAYLILI